MGELGDIFELVVCGPDRLRSARAEIRQRSGDQVRRGVVWWTGRDRVREEFEWPTGGRWLYVQDGDRWWRWNEQRGATTNTLGDPKERGSSDLHMLLNHGRLAISPELELAGREQIAGREAVILHVPEREIAVDAEYGLTLRAVHEGRRFWDVIQIDVNQPIPEKCFGFSAPDGVELRAASSNIPPPMPIEEVATRVSFPIFAPGPIMIGWPIDAQHWERRGEQPEHVTVRLRERPIWIQQSERWNPESFVSRFETASEWTRVVQDGVELDVRERPAAVRLVKDGVHLEVYGGLDNLEELIPVALSLRPV
jgi:hypothetical protein